MTLTSTSRSYFLPETDDSTLYFVVPFARCQLGHCHDFPNTCFATCCLYKCNLDTVTNTKLSNCFSVNVIQIKRYYCIRAHIVRVPLKNNHIHQGFYQYHPKHRPYELTEVVPRVRCSVIPVRGAIRESHLHGWQWRYPCICVAVCSE